MKKTRLQRKSRSEIRKIQDELWQLCRERCFERDNKDGVIDCYTCSAKDIQGCNRQLGHLWAKASLSAVLKYDIRILKFQCYKCNIHYGGQGAIFYDKLRKEIGDEEMDALIKLKNQPPLVNAKDWYLKQIEEYSTKTSFS